MFFAATASINVYINIQQELDFLQFRVGVRRDVVWVKFCSPPSMSNIDHIFPK